MTPNPIDHISDTAAWVAAYRAGESKRDDALFKDEFAELLAGEVGHRVIHGLPLAKAMGWTVVVRTKVIDEEIERRVAAGEIDTVLNLAAGLDTRPYRLDLPSGFRWFEVDLGDMVDYKERKLAGRAPRCELKRIKLDLGDKIARQAVFSEVARGSRGVLVLTEGIIMYLPTPLVEELADELKAEPAFKVWVQDYVAPHMLRVLNMLWRRALGAGNSEFKFSTDEGREFYRKRGWQEIGFRSLVVEAKRLRRNPPFGPVLHLVMRVTPFHLARDSSGILILGRKPA